MSIIWNRSQHGLKVYKTPAFPEFWDEMLAYSEANEPEPEKELDFS